MVTLSYFKCITGYYGLHCFEQWWEKHICHRPLDNLNPCYEAPYLFIFCPYHNGWSGLKDVVKFLLDFKVKYPTINKEKQNTSKLF